MNTFQQQQDAYWHDLKQLKRRDPRDSIIRAYVEPKIKYVLQRLAIPPTNLLDVGAGNGYFSYWWNTRCRVTATDYSEVMLQANPVEDKQRMDARALAFPDKSFDVVFCHALLHHLSSEDRRTAIREMKRVARHYVVIMEPNRNNPMMAAFGLIKKEERQSLRFSPAYMQGLLQECGLSASITPFGQLTPNRMPIPRFLLPLVERVTERPIPIVGISQIVIAKI